MPCPASLWPCLPPAPPRPRSLPSRTLPPSRPPQQGEGEVHLEPHARGLGLSLLIRLGGSCRAGYLQQSRADLQQAERSDAGYSQQAERSDGLGRGHSSRWEGLSPPPQRRGALSLLHAPACPVPAHPALPGNPAAASAAPARLRLGPPPFAPFPSLSAAPLSRNPQAS